MGFNSAFKGLKKVQKEEFSAAFQKLHDRAKAYIYIYMPLELILN